LKYLQSCDLQRYTSLIVTKDESRRSGGWFGLGGGKDICYQPVAQCGADLALPFLLAQLDYEHDDGEMFAMMATLYRFFIPAGSDSDSSSNSGDGDCAAVAVAVTGPHWEKIGFQGVDPRTDLNRSMKMLTVLQVRYHHIALHGDATRRWDQV
jgi:hypothetical protein